MTSIEIVTKEDLNVFKEQLLKHISALLSGKGSDQPAKWLTSYH